MPITNLQKTNDFNGQNFYVGLDVHKKSWAITIRSLGMEVSHFTQPSGVEALNNYLQREFRVAPTIRLMRQAFAGQASMNNCVRPG